MGREWKNEFIHYGDLVIKGETKWFEFDWSTEVGQMHISKIKDEKGEEKEFFHKWPLKDFKLNWLMLTTGWDESALHTTYIINGYLSD